jgi:leucyl-tRNA synthetase
VWRLVVDEDGEPARAMSDEAPSLEAQRMLHRTIRKVTTDLEVLKFNTAIAQMMIFVNEVSRLERRPRAILAPFVLVLSPFAPHLAEELWHRLGHPDTLAYEPWPTWDEALVTEDQVTVAVQVNGKLRATLDLPRDAGQEAARAAALADHRVRRFVDGAQIRKVVFVPNKLLNLVVTDNT